MWACAPPSAPVVVPPPEPLPTVSWRRSAPAGLWFTESEVTTAVYRACLRAGRCAAAFHGGDGYSEHCNLWRADRDDHPINCVNERAAAQVCAWIGGRVPTRAEWDAEAEDAGRRRFPWGDTPADCRAAVWGNGLGADGCGAGDTAPVCSRRAGDSVSGLCDMGGNVAEWVITEDGALPRGGAWNTADAERLGARYRFMNIPGIRGYDGVRCVRDTPPPR